MSHFFKRKWILIVLLTFVSSSQVYSDYEEPDICNYENPCQPVYCDSCDCYENWVFSAGLLYFRGQQNGLECGCGP